MSSTNATPRWLLGLVTSALAACSGSDPGGPLEEPGSAGGEQLATDGSDFASSTSAFGIELYRGLAQRPGNLAMSPASVSTALTMTWGGARGETAAEMQRALHLDPASAHESAGALLRGWNDANQRAYDLRVANRLFVQAGYDLDPAFVALQRDTYEAPLTPVDFAGATEAARAQINRWVSDRTEERIPEVLPAGSLGTNTRLVVTNAVYFHGRWTHPFDPEQTRGALFHLGAEQTAEVPTMALTAGLRHASDDRAAILELPYEGGDLAMLFVLPNEGQPLDGLERDLDPARLAGWLEALAPRRVSVRLPRFRVDAPPIRLKPALEALGIHRAFAVEADLSGIAAPTRTGEPGLFVDEVFHRAFVDVNEEGTEAAAATAVVVNTRRAGPPAVPFHADRPFLFLLRDTRSGALLFIGRVADPRG